MPAESKASNKQFTTPTHPSLRCHLLTSIHPSSDIFETPPASTSSNMSISVEVSGTLLPRNRAVLDLYKPKLRSFDTPNGDIEHLDVVTTWKGLSINNALEIIFWERATKKALEHHVEEALVAMFFKRVKDHSMFHGSSSIAFGSPNLPSQMIFLNWKWFNACRILSMA
jgi:hypothetical protein